MTDKLDEAHWLSRAEEVRALAEGMREQASEHAETIAEAIAHRAPLAGPKVVEIMNRVRERQRAVGYEGNYHAWLAKMTPPDLQ